MEDQAFSSILSKALDCMGYSIECMRIRQDSAAEIARVTNDNSPNIDSQKEMVPVGSKAEGISNFYESYLYYLDSINALCCVDDVRGASLRGYHEIFFADIDSTAPCYVLVEHVLTASNIERRREVVEQYRDMLLRSTIAIERGTSLISSDSFSAEEHKRNKLVVKRSGPAVLGFLDDYKNGLPKITRQFVPSILKIAIPFKCGGIFKTWARRERKYGWPPKSAIEQIVKMDSHIVPGGHCLSDSRNHEWKVCFGAAEKQLVLSMNDTQFKLYSLLRLLCKRVFKLVCQKISSYMMKTVVFWVSEKCVIENFRPCLLKELLTYALQIFKEGLMNNNLPDYFMTEHNLLLGVVSNSERHILLVLLSEIVNRDLYFLFTLPALRNIYNYMSTVQCFPVIALREQKSREVANRIDQIVRQRIMTMPKNKIFYLLNYKHALRKCIIESNNDPVYVSNYMSAFYESTCNFFSLTILLEMCIEMPMYCELFDKLADLEQEIDPMMVVELAEALMEYLLT